MSVRLFGILSKHRILGLPAGTRGIVLRGQALIGACGHVGLTGFRGFGPERGTARPQLPVFDGGPGD
jgi:hypothetical protein